MLTFENLISSRNNHLKQPLVWAILLSERRQFFAQKMMMVMNGDDDDDDDAMRHTPKIPTEVLPIGKNSVGISSGFLSSSCRGCWFYRL